MPAIRVLVIDDSLTIRAILESMLERAGLTIIGLADGVEEAKSMLAERCPDIVTLDLSMPGMDGMEYLAELAQGSHPPVVVLSASTPDKSDRAKQALAAGAVACFDKSNLTQNGPRFVRMLQKQVERSKRIPTAA
jgi:two-component system, chemotaxis family, protein-glutamate methylesterase/glutaminase